MRINTQGYLTPTIKAMIIQENTKSGEIQKPSFPKEKVKNADF